MVILPITLKQANEFVEIYHRHNKPVQGHKWSLGLWDNNNLIGVAITGRPIARLLDDGLTLEILRVCTNGQRNSNSFLYGRVARIAHLMGYQRIITYTLKKESGASLRAIGAKAIEASKPGSWNRSNRLRENQSVFWEEKIRWEF